MSRIFLVRHGQASWGAENYDALSELGRRQAAATGWWLGGRGIVPARLISGELVRQRDSLSVMATGAGWEVPLECSGGWDEYDHLAVLAALPTDDPVYAASAGLDERRAFDAVYAAALRRWVLGRGDYRESYAAFTDRTTTAMESLAAALAPGEDAVVATSGGVISVIGAHLLDGGPRVWDRLQRTVVNASVTQVRVGARGIHLMSFNEASHLGDLWSAR
ncbi:histidine phosphatase family protein [Nostocoides veronense]|uniref:Histidine phosphatase family protein n=1 Tax=Nostocoides veronense TaxID=330836 RepID=A0ABN2LLF3_9MICO